VIDAASDGMLSSGSFRSAAAVTGVPLAGSSLWPASSIPAADGMETSNVPLSKRKTITAATRNEIAARHDLASMGC
jgi:hypothetical protein